MFHESWNWILFTVLKQLNLKKHFENRNSFLLPGLTGEKLIHAPCSLVEGMIWELFCPSDALHISAGVEEGEGSLSGDCWWSYAMSRAKRVGRGWGGSRGRIFGHSPGCWILWAGSGREFKCAFPLLPFLYAEDSHKTCVYGQYRRVYTVLLLIPDWKPQSSKEGAVFVNGYFTLVAFSLFCLGCIFTMFPSALIWDM